MGNFWVNFFFKREFKKIGMFDKREFKCSYISFISVNILFRKLPHVNPFKPQSPVPSQALDLSDKEDDYMAVAQVK